jgi:hypothetical protein
MNIFAISPRLGPEDRFTAHWHYLLSTDPSLGQRVVNHICKSAGLPETRYEQAIDHPEFTRTDRPDFLLKCSDFDIVCEHKLGSDLGDSQLERYCRITEKRNNSYLVLIANQARLGVSKTVKVNPVYAYPQSADCPYFLWESFFGLVKQSENRLAREFLDYMEGLGMAPWRFGDWGDPFMQDAAAEQFRQLWRPVQQLFTGPGVVRKVDRVSLGMQVQKPIKDIDLIYFDVRKGPSELPHEFSGPGIYLRVLPLANSPGLEKIGDFNGVIKGQYSEIDVRTPSERKLKASNKVLVRQYGIPLSQILGSDATSAKQRLVDFVQVSISHLRDEMASSVESQTHSNVV